MEKSIGPRIRLTISVTPEVHAVFSRLASVANTSLSRAMGEWLADTAEAAVVMVDTIEKAREAPRDAIRRINLVTASLVAENEALVERIESRSAAEPVRADRREHAPAEPVAPSSLTGLNPPSKRKRV